MLREKKPLFNEKAYQRLLQRSTAKLQQQCDFYGIKMETTKEKTAAKLTRYLYPIATSKKTTPSHFWDYNEEIDGV